MEWLAALEGQTVGLDTAPLIYFIEEDPRRLPRLRPFFERLDRGHLRIVTSTVTLLEVLVQPLRRANADMAARYREILLHSSGITTLAVTAAISETAAQLRAQHNLRTPDAIQLATALHGGASYFLSNDTDLPAISGLQILVLDELAGP